MLITFKSSISPRNLFKSLLSFCFRLAKMNVNLVFNEQQVSNFIKNGNQLLESEKTIDQSFQSNQSVLMLTEKYKNFNSIISSPRETIVSYSSNLNTNYPNNLLTSQNENVIMNTISQTNCVSYQKTANCAISTSSLLVKNINDENSDAISNYNLLETNMSMNQTLENKCCTNSLESLSQPLNNLNIKTKAKKSSMQKLNIFCYKDYQFSKGLIVYYTQKIHITSKSSFMVICSGKLIFKKV